MNPFVSCAIVCALAVCFGPFPATCDPGIVPSNSKQLESSFNENTSPANGSLGPLTPLTAASTGYCDDNGFCYRGPFEPQSPLVRCSFLPLEFLDCEEPEDLDGNYTKKEELGYGCVKFGGQRFEQVEQTSVECEVLPGIECYGERKFRRDGFPCIKYSGHYFTTTLLYSILLGFLGMDRFCLGKTGTAVGKLLTLGGVGIWWIVDIILLIVGILRPEDNSNWVIYA